MLSIKIKGAPSVPFLPGFEPFKSLWTGLNSAYPSEHAARWAMRKLRDDLAKAQAVALHRSRLMVHPQRFAAVAEQAALAEFANRAGAV